MTTSVSNTAHRDFSLTEFFAAFSPGLFSYPLYHSEWPEAIKYGSFGTQVTYPLFSHFFNISRHLRDANAKIEAIKCLLDRKSKKVEDTRILEFEKWAEDIFVLTLAIRTSFHAYRNSINGKQAHTGLLLEAKGNRFDNQFFISAAQNYCNRNIYDPSLAPEPDYAEIQFNQACMNIGEFKRVFNCSRNDRMVPEKICQ